MPRGDAGGRFLSVACPKVSGRTYPFRFLSGYLLQRPKAAGVPSRPRVTELLHYDTDEGPTANILCEPELSRAIFDVGYSPPNTPGTASLMAELSIQRGWESPRPSFISWFPPGAKATAVASPAPGSKIKPDSPITLTFSKPVGQVLGSHLPPVSPITAGTSVMIRTRWSAVRMFQRMTL